MNKTTSTTPVHMSMGELERMKREFAISELNKLSLNGIDKERIMYLAGTDDLQDAYAVIKRKNIELKMNIPEVHRYAIMIYMQLRIDAAIAALEGEL